MSAPKVTPVSPPKRRDVEPELRRAVGSGWARYLWLLSKGQDDSSAVRELDAMAVALDELRNAASRRLGCI